ncbi:hypothetical protein ACF0H5_012629 [Mactra antiquata]
MLVIISSLLVLGGSHVLGQNPVSSCVDLDSNACALFAQAKPDLCSDPTFASGTCRRFCGNCPLECYSCPTPVLDPRDCNTTITCGVNQTCMTKHLHALDGHDEYIYTCEEKRVCDGFSLGFAFGKRDTEMEEGRDRRDVSLACCDTDFCNTPSLPGPFPNGCDRDIVFVLDDSGSVGTTNFKKSLDFVQSVVNEVNVGPNNAQIALLTYSTHAQVGWHLNQYQDKTSILNALSTVRYLGGITHTDEALETVRTQLLTPQNGDRPNNENVVIVLTDGQSNNKINTVQEANKLHTVSHDVISIVIGQGINLNELNAIATDNHHIFDIRSFGDLASILPQLMQVICNA